MFPEKERPRSSAALPREVVPVLREELRHGLGLHEFAGLVEVVHHDGLRVDAEAVINRGEEFRRVDGVFHGRAAGLVGLAVDVAAICLNYSSALQLLAVTGDRCERVGQRREAVSQA